MKKVVFKDGRESIVDADFVMCPSGEVQLVKVTPEGNQLVQRYATAMVKDVVDTVVPSVKLFAIKLLGATSSVPHGSRKLAEMAGIEYSELVVAILKKLRAVGKVTFTDGKWTRA